MKLKRTRVWIGMYQFMSISYFIAKGVTWLLIGVL